MQFVGNLPTNWLSVFDHFVGLALKGLSNYMNNFSMNDQDKLQLEYHRVVFISLEYDHFCNSETLRKQLTFFLTNIFILYD